jgi:hypothetical protein
VAQHVLNHFSNELGIDFVEGKQKIPGHLTGTTWEIDAKAVCEHANGFLIVECRRYTVSRQSQEQLAAIAFRIQDTGAVGGIIVTPMGLQEGAIKVAEATNVIELKLPADATLQAYLVEFLGKTFAVFSDYISVSETLTVIKYDNDGNYVETITTHVT